MTARQYTKALGTSMPIYVTNATADGTIAYYSMPLWASLAGLLVVFFNALLWGGIGIYKAVEVIL
jgi:hypothetical protein